MTPENTNHTAGDAIPQQPDRESLSALFDGELHDAASRFAIKRLGHDAQWRDAFGRWQLAGDVLRRQQVGMAPAGFAQRVEAAMAGEAAMPGRGVFEATQEATDQTESTIFEKASRTRAGRGRSGRTPPATVGARHRRWVTGGALAASVAVAALLVARPMLDDPAQPASLTGSGDSALPAATLQPAVPAASLASTPDETPAGSSLADASTAVAAAALAAAKAPRAAAEPRSRSQRQAAGSRQVATASASRALVREPDDGLPGLGERGFGEPADRATAVATAGSAFGPAESGSAHPFQPQPGEIQTRPWPRAMLPQSSADTFTVGYDLRRSDRPARSFYPFEPRMPSFERAPAPADGRPLQFSEGPRP